MNTAMEKKTRKYRYIISLEHSRVILINFGMGFQSSMGNEEDKRTDQIFIEISLVDQ